MMRRSLFFIFFLFSFGCSFSDESEGARKLVESCILRDPEMFEDSLTKKMKEIRIASSGSWEKALNDYCPKEMVREYFGEKELSDIDSEKITYEITHTDSQTLADVYYKGKRTLIGGAIRNENGWKWDSN